MVRPSRARPLPRHFRLFLPVFGLASAGATTGPAVPDRPPVTRPTTGAADPSVARWFDGLADPDPVVRDAARTALMRLSTDRLPALRAAISDRPVRPAQAMALREIVEQVYLAGQPYVAVGGPDDPTHATVPQYVMGIHRSEDEVDAARMGVPVLERWPGFPANAVLRDGDLILGVYVDSALPLQQLPNMTTHQWNDLTYTIQRANVRFLALEVLRDGVALRVPMELVPKPVEMTNLPAVDAFIQGRRRQADGYWQAHFAAFVQGPPTASLDD